ncbi:MAG: hypothetical protein PGMFKBFP_02396 [Anaerolineales bacterium]|nr:hypothetical protein [Anaerolineales bacterium]
MSFRLSGAPAGGSASRPTPASSTPSPPSVFNAPATVTLPFGSQLPSGSCTSIVAWQNEALPARSIAHNSTSCSPNCVQSNVMLVIGLPKASTGKPVPEPARRMAYFNFGAGVQLSSPYCKKSTAHSVIMPPGMMFTDNPS